MIPISQKKNAKSELSTAAIKPDNFDGKLSVVGTSDSPKSGITSFFDACRFIVSVLVGLQVALATSVVVGIGVVIAESVNAAYATIRKIGPFKKEEVVYMAWLNNIADSFEKAFKSIWTDFGIYAFKTTLEALGDKSGNFAKSGGSQSPYGSGNPERGTVINPQDAKKNAANEADTLFNSVLGSNKPDNPPPYSVPVAIGSGSADDVARTGATYDSGVRRGSFGGAVSAAASGAVHTTEGGSPPTTPPPPSGGAAPGPAPSTSKSRRSRSSSFKGKAVRSS